MIQNLLKNGSRPQRFFLPAICLPLCLLVLSACGEEIPDTVVQESFTIASGHTGGSYEIRVALPPDHDPDELHPVIYVLDGDWYFAHVSRENARIGGDSGKRSAIVVGIGHGNPRTTDYTPTATDEGGGGAVAFTRFLEEELMPAVEVQYAAGTARESRLILGHSVGGLYAAYAFTRHNQLFGNYLILSPSVWYDDGLILRYEEEGRGENRSAETIVFVSNAEVEPTQLYMHMFSERIAAHYPQTDLVHHTVRRRNHSSSANPAISEGLRFYYNLKEE